ncbi:lamin tail domain-containing protein, partial [Candidatus Woesearchaeota archaeon]|nr:lamin tail domain-containing protein [Candidatus Woesearchaeota archaeon]
MADKKEVLVVILGIFIIFLSPNVNSEVLINEILANGVDDPESEWVELYNNGNFDVDLANWNLSETSSKNFTLNVTIPANGFIILTGDFATFNA